MAPGGAFPLEPYSTRKPACKINPPTHQKMELPHLTSPPKSQCQHSPGWPDPKQETAPSLSLQVHVLLYVHQCLAFSSCKCNTLLPPPGCSALNLLHNSSTWMPAYCSLKIKKAFVIKNTTAQNLPKVHLVCRGKPSYLPSGLSSLDSHT